MQFYIPIVHDKKRYRLFVEQVYFSSKTERFAVHGKQGQLIFESNRPLFRNKRLMHRVPDWKLVEGQLLNASLREVIIEAIMKHLEGVKKPVK